MEFQGCVWCYTMTVKVIQFSSVHQCVLKSWIPGNTGLLATANRELRWMNGGDGCQLDTIGLYDQSFHREAVGYASGFYCCQSPSENGCFNCVLWNLTVRRMKSGIHPQHKVKSNDKSQNAGRWLAKSCGSSNGSATGWKR